MIESVVKPPRRPPNLKGSVVPEAASMSALVPALGAFVPTPKLPAPVILRLLPA